VPGQRMRVRQGRGPSQLFDDGDDVLVVWDPNASAVLES
jgi:hypothetical protein